MPKTRSERRKVRKEVYLDGRAGNPHRHTPMLQMSLEEACSTAASTGVCPQCEPVLSKYADTFKAMVHQGSDLKRKIAVNPHPKRADTTPYRDLVRQNEWLRQNVFDSLGNYLYCAACIHAALGVSKDRLTRQRNIKCKQSQQPTVDMVKSEVEEKRLGSYVIMPANVQASFKNWWRSRSPSAIVQVRFPHERHGNAGRVSNNDQATN